MDDELKNLLNSQKEIEEGDKYFVRRPKSKTELFTKHGAKWDPNAECHYYRSVTQNHPLSDYQLDNYVTVDFSDVSWDAMKVVQKYLNEVCDTVNYKADGKFIFAIRVCDESAQQIATLYETGLIKLQKENDNEE